MRIVHTDATALELARKLAPLYGLAENQLPTQIFAGVLNGLAECEAILAAIPQQETPAPVVQHVSDWLP
jgi:hypothetical protein